MLSYNLYGQDTPPTDFFYEIIKNDSIVMFFNQYGQFTDKQCAEYKRYVRSDNNGNFNSSFIDIDVKNDKIIAKGQYVGGKLHNTFEWFYPNGNKRLVGHYNMGTPAGTWRYFHKSTQPERTLEISDGEVLLHEFQDSLGHVRVHHGNGTFEGEIPFFSDHGGTVATGEVENGKAHNTWTATFLGQPFATEKFKHGQLKYGNSPDGAFVKDQYDKPNLNHFMIVPRYVTQLESFKTERCAETSTTTKRINPRYEYAVDRFNQEDHDMKLAFDLLNSIHKVAWKTKVRDNDTYYMTMKLTLNKRRKIENTELVSEFGQAYFNAFSSVLTEHLVFPNAPETIYLHIRMYLAYHIRKRVHHIFTDTPKNIFITAATAGGRE